MIFFQTKKIIDTIKHVSLFDGKEENTENKKIKKTKITNKIDQRKSKKNKITKKKIRSPRTLWVRKKKRI